MIRGGLRCIVSKRSFFRHDGIDAGRNHEASAQSLTREHVPGFVTDALGLLLLFPPTRIAARTALKRRFRGRVYRIGPNGPGGPGGPGWPNGPGNIIDV